MSGGFGLAGRASGGAAPGTGDGPGGAASSAATVPLASMVPSASTAPSASSMPLDPMLAGPLAPLLAVVGVTDVLVNGPREVWLDRGAGLEQAEVDLGDESRVRALAVRLAAAGGARLDDASPVADARLPGGVRLHAVLPPLARGCTALSLRVPRAAGFSLPELVAAGTVPPPLEPVLRALVARRANLLVTGATGTGKTTLLAALLSLVDPRERIVVVEEATELEPSHPHVVHLAARRANVEGVGAVGLDQLVRAALRMRPDRIVLGEARGRELREVLSALTTGHEGGCATLHAGSAALVPARLEALGALAGLDRAAVAAQAAAAFDAVLHLRRDEGGRRLDEVAVVRRDLGGELEVVDALLVDGRGRVLRGPGWPSLAERLALVGLEPGHERGGVQGMGSSGREGVVAGAGSAPAAESRRAHSEGFW